MMADLSNPGRYLDDHTGLRALLLEHGNDVARCTVAEELAQRFLVPADVVFFYQLQEVSRGVTRQSRLGKVRVRGKEVFRGGVQIREVATASARDEDLFPDALGMFQHQDTPTATTRMHGAEQTGSAASHDEHVIVVLGCPQHSSGKRSYGRLARLRECRGRAAGPDLGRRGGL